MEIKLIINKAVVVSNSGADKVLLYTDLPGACYPWDLPLTVDFHAGRGSGVKYIKENFPGVPIELVGK